MARYYIKRRYYGSAADFAETEEAPKPKKKRTALKIAAGLTAAAGAAAGAKYGGKAYAKRIQNRSIAKRAAGDAAGARQMRQGGLYKVAKKVGGLGDKQIRKGVKAAGKAKRWVTGEKEAPKGRNKKKREKRRAKLERMTGKEVSRRFKSDAKQAKKENRTDARTENTGPKKKGFFGRVGEMIGGRKKPSEAKGGETYRLG